MAKSIYKITEFEGGENRVKDPRDIDNIECSKAVGVDFDKLGRVRLSGTSNELKPLGAIASPSVVGTLHSCGNTDNPIIKITPGYGIYRFNHDYNMDNDLEGETPQEISSEFIAIAYTDGSDDLCIGFIDSRAGEYKTFFNTPTSGYPDFNKRITITSAVTTAHKPKVSYYFVDGGLRICDGEFRNAITPIIYMHTRNIFFQNISNATYTSGDSENGIWVLEDQSLELSKQINHESRPNEMVTTALDATLNLRPLSSNFTGSGRKVRLEIEENQSIGTGKTRIGINNNAYSNGITTITTGDNSGAYNHPYNAGDMIQIFKLSSPEDIFNGTYEVIDAPSATTFTISADTVAGDWASQDDAFICFAEDVLNPELRAQWIYGISYVLDGGQETQIAVGDATSAMIESGSNQQMSSTHYHDWTGFINEPKIRFQFSHDSTFANATNPWGDRVTGFRIYMKNINGTNIEQASLEWHLLVDVDFIKGQYILPCKDSTEHNLVHQENTTLFYNIASESETNAGGDDIRFLTPITYESLNEHTGTETITAEYKTSIIANKRVYIGNVKQDGMTYPDRIIRSPVNAYDVFPESNFIHAVVADGDSIVKLEVFGDRLFCFKEETLFIINISDEVEFLEDTLVGYGIKHQCNSLVMPDGVIFVNKKGIFLHNGSEVKNLTKEKRSPFNFNPKDIFFDGFFYEDAVPILGYEQDKNKIILIRAGRAYDYQVTVTVDGFQSIQNGFIRNSGYIKIGKGSAPLEGDIFSVTGAYDFEGDDLSYAKYGMGGRELNAGDTFLIASNSSNSQKIKYLDLDADVLILSLNNGSISYRAASFGSANIGYNMTNFINTNMFDYSKLLLLKDATGTSQAGTDTEILEWNDHPAAIESLNGTFQYRTKDFDFGDPAIRKKVYKVYVTFKSNDDTQHVNSMVRVYYLINQNTNQSHLNVSDYTEFDSTNSTNYSTSNGLYSEASDSDWQIAELKPTSAINNIYSFQLLFRNSSGDVPKGFQINDISIVYRKKSIR